MAALTRPALARRSGRHRHRLRLIADNPRMLTINKLIPRGRGLAKVLLQRAPNVTLDWDVRQKSRFDATDSSGRALAVFLPRGTQVRGGDVLVGEDGSLVLVQAADQPVLVVRHCSEHGSPFDLMRAAYHLGNRHVALELQPDHLKLEPDHVLAEMLRNQHLIVGEAQAAFEPEGGAYGQGHGHDHSHGHGHSHGDGHGHGHAHAESKPVAIQVHSRGDHSHEAHAGPSRGQPPQHGHVHGPGCGHDHDDHGHSH
jgi:urease accessory protein